MVCWCKLPWVKSLIHSILIRISINTSIIPFCTNAASEILPKYRKINWCSMMKFALECYGPKWRWKLIWVEMPEWIVVNGNTHYNQIFRLSFWQYPFSSNNIWRLEWVCSNVFFISIIRSLTMHRKIDFQVDEFGFLLHVQQIFRSYYSKYAYDASINPCWL